MNKKLLTFAVLHTLLLSGSISAQDLVFSQFTNAPLLLNPAFAGRSSIWNISASIRTQYPDISNAYQSIQTSVDKHFDHLNSGIGINIFTDQSGDGIFQRTNARLAYSYLARFSRDQHLRLGLDLGYQNLSLQTNKLLFPDQLNVLGGDLILPTSENLALDRLSNFDISVGMLYYTPLYFVGGSVQHLNQSAASFYEQLGIGFEPLVQLHAGFEFQIDRVSPDFFVSPAVLYAQQSKLSQLNLGSFVRYSSMSVSAWFRFSSINQDAFILALGLHKDKYRIGYSYDLNISRLSTIAGAHELTFAWKIGNDNVDLNDCFNMFR